MENGTKFIEKISSKKNISLKIVFALFFSIYHLIFLQIYFYLKLPSNSNDFNFVVMRLVGFVIFLIVGFYFGELVIKHYSLGLAIFSQIKSLFKKKH
jgi:hypothetical protein